jgi:hypothetical protein
MRKLTLGTLLAALAASAILAAPGGAAKPAYTITCTVGVGGMTTLTWASGTTGYSGEWFASDGTTPTGQFSNIAPLGNGPGSTTFSTAPNSATASVTFTGRKVGAKLAPVACTPA